MMVVFALPEYLSNVENSQQKIVSLLIWFFLTLPFAVVTFFIWNPWLKAIFVRTVIEFNPDKIIVWEQAFGSQRKILSISQSDLLPLQEKKINTQVPQVRNSSLCIRYRRKNIELAGHLLPKAMDTVRDTYDCYRNNSFSYFYSQVKNIHLE